MFRGINVLSNITSFCCAGLVCIVLHFSALLAQERPTPLHFQHFSAEEGLPQNTVSCILQDHFGYLWFGTQDGLARYDGYSFTVFRHNPQDSATLSSSNISTLLEDRAGALWIGTNGGGLNCFDRATGTFMRYEHHAADPSSLSNSTILSLLEDRAGVLWVGTSGGLNRFNRVNGTFKRYNFEESESSSSGANNIVRAILEDHSQGRYAGALWVGTFGGGLNRFDPATGKFTRYQHNPADKNSLSNNSVTSLLEERIPSRNGAAIWVGTSGGGLNRFDPATGKFIWYQHNPADPASLSQNKVFALLQDRAGTLWAGTESGGLNRLDHTTGKFTRYKHNPRDRNSLSGNIVRSLLEDRSGALWIGVYDGLNRFDPATMRFAHYEHNPSDKNSLSNSGVFSFLEDRSGALWVGTLGGGLNRFDRTAKKFTSYKQRPNDKNSLSSNIVQALLEEQEDKSRTSPHNGRSGILWVGTWGGGLNRFDPSTGKFTRYQHNPNDENSLSNNSVVSLLEERNNVENRGNGNNLHHDNGSGGGTLWVGTYGGGLNRFDRATGTFTRYQHSKTDRNSLSNNAVFCLLEDRAGTLWVGTFGGGLNRFDRATGKFTRYEHTIDDKNSLSDNNVTSLLEDKAGTLWVGTVGGGLNRFDRNTGTFRAFREKDGLPNDVVYGILEDDHENLWLSTNKGVCKFNPRKSTFTNFDKHDGLQNNEFNSGAYFRTRNGQMYFGGISGFNEFFPDSIRIDTTPPPVLITIFRKFNRPTALDSAIEEKKILTLAHSDNTIGFEFAAMSYRISERILYSYKLEKFDQDWSPIGTKREATYTNLDPGEYIFRVKACNSDGVWNNHGASVRIIITPPWWARWWARLAFAVCIAGTLYPAYLWRVSALARHNERLEKQVRERTAELNDANEEITRQMKIHFVQAKNIEIANKDLQSKNVALEQLNTEKNEFLGIAAHDLKNPLAGIVLSTDILMHYSQGMSAEDRYQRLKKIGETAQYMNNIVTNLLDVNAIESENLHLHPETINLTDAALRIVNDYRDRAAAKNITLRFEPNIEHLSAFADVHTTSKILDNLISNAIKYSPMGKSVTVRVFAGNDMVRVEVQDEGPGLSEEDKTKLFGKFARLSARPTGGEQSTGLGLSIVKKLVEAMNGHVWCESELGKGATFIVELPTA